MRIEINNITIKSGKAFELSTDPEFEILSADNDPLMPKERVLTVNKSVLFPAASVTVVELAVG